MDLIGQLLPKLQAKERTSGYGALSPLERTVVDVMGVEDVNHLCLAVPLAYKYQSGGRAASSPDYANTLSVATALFGHSRFRLPYGLPVLGY